MNVPLLRFPEFEGGWARTELGSHCQTTTGRLDANAMREDGQYKFFTCAKEVYQIDEFAFDSEALLVSGNGANVGYIHYYRGKFNAYQRTYVLDQFDLDIRFVQRVLERDLRKRIYGEVKEGNTPYIVKSTLTEMPLSSPSLPEQEKIAAFLGVVDARIAALRDRVAGLERYKRGLMQALFSQSLRFTKPDGIPFPDWKEKRLGEVAAINKGKQLNRDTLDTAGRYPVVNGGVAPSGYHDAYNTEAGAITISEGGNSCGFVGFQRTQFWSGGHCYVLAPNRLLINNDFLFQVLKFEELSIMRLRVGSGLPNIQKGDLTKFALPIPHPDEQAKIAKALSAMDAKIAAVTDQLARMQDFKKGLLQQMFV